MVELTFKEVGQGDSIIIEWADERTNFIGLIDCNLKPKGINPTLNYLAKLKYTEIDFIILSHPHFDHYSGFNQILTFCEEKAIHIKNFYHSCATNFSYLKSAVFSSEYKKELALLFRKIQDLKKSGLISKASFITDTTKEIYLQDGLVLDFLSPSDREYDEYNKVQHKQRFDGKNNNPDANFLSTIISISNENYSVLLTSDANTFALKRLLQKEKKKLKKDVALAQVPHHGAEGNHYQKFWNGLKLRSSIPIVISVGENDYNHPSLNVIKSFQRFGANVYSTNDIKDCRQPSAEEVSSYLDWFSKRTTPALNFLSGYSLGDLKYQLHKDQVLLV